MSTRARHDPWFAKTPEERAHEWQSEMALAALLGVKVTAGWNDSIGERMMNSGTVVERKHEGSGPYAPDDDEPPLLYRLRADVPLESAVALAMLEQDEAIWAADYGDRFDLSKVLTQLARAPVPKFDPRVAGSR